MIPTNVQANKPKQAPHQTKPGQNKLTSEYVSPMHPDKMCDRIADALVDKCLEADPNARCAIEVMGGHGEVYITGEVTTKDDSCLSPTIIIGVVHSITGKKELVDINIKDQSPEIAKGVDDGGAGDQGVVVGYACSENEEGIPHEHYLAKSLCNFIYEKYPADGKTQITIDTMMMVHAVVISWSGQNKDTLRQLFNEWQQTNQVHMAPQFKVMINPAGYWEQGGFDVDSGVTGRKIVVDQYGPRVAVGGGAFSGKDCTKIDRSGALKARLLAVEILRTSPKVINNVVVKLAYVIGVKGPVMATVEVNGNAPRNLVYEDGELDTQTIIKDLKLNEPQFLNLATNGIFGEKEIWNNPVIPEKPEKEVDTTVDDGVIVEPAKKGKKTKAKKDLPQEKIKKL